MLFAVCRWECIVADFLFWSASVGSGEVGLRDWGPSICQWHVKGKLDCNVSGDWTVLAGLSLVLMTATLKLRLDIAVRA